MCSAAVSVLAGPSGSGGTPGGCERLRVTNPLLVQTDVTALGAFTVCRLSYVIVLRAPAGYSPGELGRLRGKRRDGLSLAAGSDVEWNGVAET